VDIIGTVTSFIGQIFDALRNTPAGLGIILIPLALLWIIVIGVSRRR
jgi:hypothetical protein